MSKYLNSMKQFLKILFACLSAILLFFLIILFAFAGLVAGVSKDSEKTNIDKNSLLVIDMNKPIAEQTQKNPFGTFTKSPTSVVGLNDILNSIKAAQTDDKIKGIYIKLGANPNGWATLQEIKNAIVDFKANSKKFVFAYGEICDQKSYYVASAGDKIFLNPVGGFEFNGLSITGTFFKGTLDKLGITTEAFHCGKYKGAYEPYKLDKFSEPNRYQLSVMLNDFYSEFLQTVSKKTGLDTNQLIKISNEGTIKFPSDALKNHFVDATIYGDSVESILKSQIGIKSKDKIKLVTPEDYVNSIDTKFNNDKIAVLYADGAIYDGDGDDGVYSKRMISDIRKISEDDNVKALVLRVNSPGGSAMASEVIYHELMKLKSRIPIIVSMGNYAASGGYYLPCAGDSIFADNNTITGSIGVVGVMMNYGNALKDKVGVTTDVVKTSTYADFPSVTRPFTDAERNWIQSYLDTTYTLFKSRVAVARNMTMEQVEDLAQGHVYSGTLALQLKLIDAIGNKEDAITCAAKKVNLKNYQIEEYPKRKDKLKEMIEEFSGQNKEDAIVKKVLGDDYLIFKEIQKLKAQKNQIMAVKPFQN